MLLNLYANKHDATLYFIRGNLDCENGNFTKPKKLEKFNRSYLN